MERPRPELDPLGVRAGAFIVFPDATITESFDDNIFANDGATVDEFITNIVPRVLVRSDWQNHELRIFGSADVDLYADRSNENYEDIELGADARIDVLRDLKVTAGLAWSGLHESRGSPDDVDGDEPTEYDQSTAKIGVVAKLNRISLALDGDFTRLDFDDAVSSGAVIYNDDCDRDRYRIALRAGYEIAPEYEGFVRIGVRRTDYDDALDGSGVNRDSDGIEAVAGARIDVTGVIFGDVFAGYLVQDYEDSTLETIDGPTAGVDREDELVRFGLFGKYLLNRNLYISLGYDFTQRESDAAGADYDKNVVKLSLKARL